MFGNAHCSPGSRIGVQRRCPCLGVTALPLELALERFLGDPWTETSARWQKGGDGRKAESGTVVLDQSCSLSKVIQTRTPFQEPSQRKSSPEVKSMALAAYLTKIRR